MSPNPSTVSIVVEEVLRRFSEEEKSAVVANPEQMIVAIRTAIIREISSGTLGDPAVVLSPREKQVLDRLAMGLTNREIAKELGISVKTIDTHRGHVLKKLGLRNNADITRVAVKYGYVQV